MSTTQSSSGPRQRHGAASPVSSSSSPSKSGQSAGTRAKPSGSAASSPSTSTPQKGHIIGRCIRQCGWLVVYVIIAVVTPMVMNHAALSKEQKELMPTPGSMVRINRHQRLFMRCLGHGSPVVILEAPMGKDHTVFERLQLSLAKHTRVCSYDRAGLGFSERPLVNRSEPTQRSKSNGMPHTVEDMAEDLYKLIVVESGLPPPYVLVGVELGSLITRFFAQIFEGSVGAVVLVDPLVEGVENFEQGAVRQYWKETRLQPWQKQQLTAASGLYRLGLITGLAQKVEKNAMSERQLARKKHILCQPAHWQAAVEELFLVNETMAQIQLLWRIKSFPVNISVAVVTADSDSTVSPAVNKAWKQAQKHLVDKLHPGCRHKHVSGVTGASLLEKRSAVLHELVLNSVDQVRESVAATAASKQKDASDTATESSKETNAPTPTVLPPPPSQPPHVML